MEKEFILVPFKARHLLQLDLQKSQQYLSEFITPEQMKTLEYSNECQAWTGLVDGRAIGCIGVLKQWDGRAVAWAYLDKDSGKYMVRGFRLIQKYLDITPYKRIEATVDIDFKEGHRMAKLLGFKLEAECMKAFLPNGEDAALYARIS